MTAPLMPSRNPLSCNANQPFTHAPVRLGTRPSSRPGSRPSSCPGTSGSAFTNDVIHGSNRLHPASPFNHRTDLARVSSIPSALVGWGDVGHRAVTAGDAVGQLLTQPAGHPGPRRELPVSVEERLAGTGPLQAPQPPFPAPQLHLLP